MAEQILDQYDGITEYFDFDDLTKEVTVRRVRDVQPLIEENKRIFNEGLQNRHCEFRRIGSFDPMVVEQWKLNRKIPKDVDVFARGNEKLLTLLVNDPDMAAFRTLPGRYTFKVK